ncbi:hypothetical protein [Undibacterium sp. Ji22W]|uniref:hypothetical protein n=1 Tax=Undibacterium sp. Ji22W TaxID=3413038 RepID=UPI003BF2716E
MAIKINIHVHGFSFEPKAHLPALAALDTCFIIQQLLDEVIKRLDECNWPIIEEPVIRAGASGKIEFV